MPPESLFMSFASNRPPAVPKQNAISPSATIISVFTVRKFSAVAVAPTTVPSIIVIMFISSFDAVFTSLSTTPLSEEVTEHQHTNKGSSVGNDESNDKRNSYREYDFFSLCNGT